MSFWNFYLTTLPISLRLNLVTLIMIRYVYGQYKIKQVHFIFFIIEVFLKSLIPILNLVLPVFGIIVMMKKTKGDKEI